MRCIVTLVVAAFIGFESFRTQAMFAWYETQQVPLTRLFTNLQQRLAQDTNNFELTYDLARLHSMAYSTNLVSIAVRTNDDRPQFFRPGSDSGVPKVVDLPASSNARARALEHLTNAILLYERAILLLKQSTNASMRNAWIVLPLEVGHAWCLDQAGDRAEALKAYRKALALAWKQEVTGEFSFTEWVQDTWNAVKSGKNPLRVRRHRGSIGPGVCFSREIIGYMLKLLDPVEDAKEIADLKEKQKELLMMGRAITPILVPLVDGVGLDELVEPMASVPFDLDGSGHVRPWGWITPKAAWLVYDPDGKGQVTSAIQMFGNVTFWIFWYDGYAALRGLDDDGDGTLRGDELRGVALWQDSNSNGISEPGEVRAVAEWGLTSISCVGEPGSCGTTWASRGAAFRSGQTRPTYDWIASSQPVIE